MLLVLTEPADVHADHLIAKLRARDADVVRFNPADYPASAEISLTYSAAGQVSASLRTDGQRLDFREVSAVWWRRPRAPRAHADIVEPRTRTNTCRPCTLSTVSTGVSPITCDGVRTGRGASSSASSCGSVTVGVA